MPAFNTSHFVRWMSVDSMRNSKNFDPHQY